MSKALYAEVVAHLLTAISMERDANEKARLTKLCEKVIIAMNGLGK